MRGGKIMLLAGGQLQRRDASLAIGHRVQFRRQPAARASGLFAV
jgi:hypothetical protein